MNTDDSILLVLDTETTDVDLDCLHLLEVAWAVSVIKDGVIKVMARDRYVLFPNVPLNTPDLMDDYVRNMHTSSGLLEEVTEMQQRYLNDEAVHAGFGSSEAAIRSLSTTDFLGLLGRASVRRSAEVDASLSQVIASFSLDQTVYLSGSGVDGFDRQVMRRFLPGSEKLLYYRAADLGCHVRVLNLSAPGLVPWGTAPFKEPPHQAAGDVEQFVRQWQWYIDRFAAMRRAEEEVVVLREEVARLRALLPQE